tara:strand:- start:1278 stop:1466 length:189 start_codon:yes stop_codon:yes gene_type:complete
MAIHIDVTVDEKSEAQAAFQLVSFLNQLDLTGKIEASWTDRKPMSINIDWSGRVETIKDHVE